MQWIDKLRGLTGEERRNRARVVDVLERHLVVDVTVDAFSERQILNKNRGGALCTGTDGPRAGAGRSAAWCAAEASLPDGRTVRTLGLDGPRVRRGGGSRRQRLDLAPGRDPVGEERS
jgi:hypothetical protein